MVKVTGKVYDGLGPGEKGFYLSTLQYINGGRGIFWIEYWSQISPARTACAVSYAEAKTANFISHFFYVFFGASHICSHRGKKRGGGGGGIMLYVYICLGQGVVLYIYICKSRIFWYTKKKKKLGLWLKICTNPVHLIRAAPSLGQKSLFFPKWISNRYSTQPPSPPLPHHNPLDGMHISYYTYLPLLLLLLLLSCVARPPAGAGGM